MACIGGWYANYDIDLCFMYFQNLSNWDSANSVCKSFNASLLVLESEAVFDTFKNISFNFTAATNYSIWVT